MRDPAGIVVWMVSPTQSTLANYGGFATAIVEFRFRLSERLKPGNEVIPLPLPSRPVVVTPDDYTEDEASTEASSNLSQKVA